MSHQMLQRQYVRVFRTIAGSDTACMVRLTPRKREVLAMQGDTFPVRREVACLGRRCTVSWDEILGTIDETSVRGVLFKQMTTVSADEVRAAVCSRTVMVVFEDCDVDAMMKAGLAAAWAAHAPQTQVVWIQGCNMGTGRHIHTSGLLASPTIKVVGLKNNTYGSVAIELYLVTVSSKVLESIVVQGTRPDVQVFRVLACIANHKATLKEVHICAWSDFVPADIKKFLKGAHRLTNMVVEGGSVDLHSSVCQAAIECGSLVEFRAEFASLRPFAWVPEAEPLPDLRRAFLHPSLKRIDIKDSGYPEGVSHTASRMKRVLELKTNRTFRGLMVYLRSRAFNPHIAELVVRALF